MSCQCVLSNHDGDCVEAINHETRKARKPHKCTECSEFIQSGQRYEYFYGTYDGDRYEYHTCLPCVEIRTFFSCDGSWMWGCIWEELEEHLFEYFHHGCLEPGDENREPLSATAKAKVVDRWRKWKGLAAVPNEETRENQL